MAARHKSVNSRKPAGGKPTRKTDADDIPELSRAEMRELERRVKDLEDRTRYLLVSSIGSRIVLYYNIADDTFTWEEPKEATLFKRKAAASKVKSLLGRGVEIVECRVDKHGKLLKSSLQPQAKSKQPRTRPSRKRASTHTRT